MSNKKIVFITLGCIFSPIIAFMCLMTVFVVFEITIVALGDPFYLSSSAHISYAASKPLCTDVCSVVVTMTNNGKKPFHPDYFGTDGPGFAEAGHPLTYMVGGDNKKCAIYPKTVDSDLSSNIQPGDKITVELVCDNDTFSHPSQIISLDLFGTSIPL